MGSGRRHHAGVAVPLAVLLRDALGGPGETHVAGSLRRRRPLVGDVDLVPRSLDPYEVGALLAEVGCVLELSEGGPRTAYRHVASGIGVDVWTGSPGDWGTRVLHATGSGQHNVLMRRWARETRGLSITWAGVRRLADGVRIDDGTEDGAREAIGWPLLSPEERHVDLIRPPEWAKRILAILDGIDPAAHRA